MNNDIYISNFNNFIHNKPNQQLNSDIRVVFSRIWAMYGYAGLCTAANSYVGLCRAVYGYVALCMAMYGYVGLCMAMYGYVRLCIAM